MLPKKFIFQYHEKLPPKYQVLRSIEEKELKNFLSYFPQGIISLDLETTGLSPLLHQVVEISAIKITPEGKIEIFDTLINPLVPIAPESTAIHQINNEMVKESPLFSHIVHDFIDFIGDIPLLAHNAFFDIGFIIGELHRQKTLFPKNEVFDSFKLTKELLDKKIIKSFKLSNLAKHFHLDCTNFHRSFEDSFCCLMIMLKIFQDQTKYSLQERPAPLTKLNFYGEISLEDIPEHLSDFYQLKKDDLFLLQYKGKSIKERQRPVQMVSILPMPQGQMLYALCLISKQYKYFSIKKVEGISLLSNEDQKELLKNYPHEKK